MVRTRFENSRQKSSTNRVPADCGSSARQRVVPTTRSATAIASSSWIVSPAGVGSGLVRRDLRLCYHREWFVRLAVFVFRGGFQLLAADVERDYVLLLSQVKTQHAPADCNFSGSHPKKPAEVDHRGVRLPFFVEEHVDDAPHILPCRAQHVLPQNPKEVVSREIVE